MVDILIDTGILIGLVILALFLVMVGVCLFKLPLKDPEYEWRQRQLDKEFRKIGKN